MRIMNHNAKKNIKLISLVYIKHYIIIIIIIFIIIIIIGTLMCTVTGAIFEISKLNKLN
jgi:hypothetical protein